MKLKLVASTKVFRNVGNVDLPMWTCVGGNEYIVAYLEKEPTWAEVGETINNFTHYLEGQLSMVDKEVYVGFEMYDKDSLTRPEFFQLDSTGCVDFPARDLTQIDVTEQLNGIHGL
mgnify:CR=1 FL=1